MRSFYFISIDFRCGLLVLIIVIFPLHVCARCVVPFENLAWQLATDQIQTIFDANVRQRANERNLYANIFVSTLYFIVFHSAMAGIQIHTVFSLATHFSSICSVSENKRQRRKKKNIYMWKRTIERNKNTTTAWSGAESAFDQNCWHRRIVADLMEIHAQSPSTTTVRFHLCRCFSFCWNAAICQLSVKVFAMLYRRQQSTHLQKSLVCDVCVVCEVQVTHLFGRRAHANPNGSLCNASGI